MSNEATETAEHAAAVTGQAMRRTKAQALALDKRIKRVEGAAEQTASPGSSGATISDICGRP